jgi:hypothetical protein
VSTHGSLLRILVDRPDRLAGLQAAWQQGGLAVGELRVVRPRLEDTFVLRLQKQDQVAG